MRLAARAFVAAGVLAALGVAGASNVSNVPYMPSVPNLPGCGYAPVHGQDRRPAERFAVVLASSSVPDAVVADEVLAGVRDELARWDAVAPGQGYPRCEVEVLRVDEASEGIAAVPNADGRLMPSARATRLGVVARAWIVRGPSDTPHGDTGDLRAFDTSRTASSSEGAAFAYDDALRAAARRLGHKLGARIVGIPAASDD